MQPTPLEDKDMNSARWRHWIESSRRLPLFQKQAFGVYAEQFDRSGTDPFTVTVTIPYHGPILVRTTIAMMECKVAGVTIFDDPSYTAERWALGLSQFVISDCKPGDELYLREAWSRQGKHWQAVDWRLRVVIEAIPSPLGETALLPPHPRLETSDRRWVDHWNAVYVKINKQDDISLLDARGCDFTQVSTIGGTTLCTVNATKDGPCIVRATFSEYQIDSISPAASTFEIKKNGAQLDSYGVPNSGTYYSHVKASLVAASDCVAGDVFTFTRTATFNDCYTAALSVWHT